ncbi:LysR substrate-binding domain-containing protein [Crystallibacter degradans]|uniref:LysR substrate-binding domain-containing protein n=1 Tax=Crystallibacter degradans TaxID=2726743 RepID=UPI0014766819|nr:LysR family transcriptional regulator [Arthrobacter sp. SF27]
MTLRQLEYFTAVVQEGSLALAADKLFITPGSMSSALSALERSLGVQLLVRRRAKGVTLTATGSELLAHARQVLSAAESMQSAAGAIRGELSGPLHLGCFDTLSPWLVPPTLEYFAEHHPQVEVILQESSSDELQRLLVGGRLDAAFMYRLHTTAALDSTAVSDVRLQLVLPAGHRLAGQDSVHFAEMEDDPAILLALKPAPDLVVATIEATGYQPNIRWRSRNVETIRSVVGCGLAYSIIMGRPRGDRSYRGDRLVYKRIADELPTNAVQLVYAPGAQNNAKVRALRAFSTEHLVQDTKAHMDSSLGGGFRG